MNPSLLPLVQTLNERRALTWLLDDCWCRSVGVGCVCFVLFCLFVCYRRFRGRFTTFASTCRIVFVLFCCCCCCCYVQTRARNRSVAYLRKVLNSMYSMYTHHNRTRTHKHTDAHDIQTRANHQINKRTARPTQGEKKRATIRRESKKKISSGGRGGGGGGGPFACVCECVCFHNDENSLRFYRKEPKKAGSVRVRLSAAGGGG